MSSFSFFVFVLDLFKFLLLVICVLLLLIIVCLFDTDVFDSEMVEAIQNSKFLLIKFSDFLFIRCDFLWYHDQVKRNGIVKGLTLISFFLNIPNLSLLSWMRCLLILADYNRISISTITFLCIIFKYCEFFISLN